MKYELYTFYGAQIDIKQFLLPFNEHQNSKPISK